ncbi:hypothetical protein BX265_7128 [Streptomyces sp. TLI_235]|nr:hypothetical protein BX265_7128 [Streptomyces sp. TLI_235]
MPGCALTTPQLDRCRTRQPLAFTLDPATKRISATVAVPGDTATGTMKLDALSLDSGAAVARPSRPWPVRAVRRANYTATDLSASGAWSQTASGGFTYSYPITTPPSLAGSGPGVALSYNSQAVDGATSARNSQSSWIGDGWSYGPGFIERSYRPCKAAGIDKSADECWAGWNATLSLGGHSGELVRDDSGLYHLQSDDGTGSSG